MAGKLPRESQFPELPVLTTAEALLSFLQGFPGHTPTSWLHSRPDLLESQGACSSPRAKLGTLLAVFVLGSMSNLGSRPTAQHLLNFLNLPQWPQRPFLCDSSPALHPYSTPHTGPSLASSFLPVDPFACSAFPSRHLLRVFQMKKHTWRREDVGSQPKVPAEPGSGHHRRLKLYPKTPKITPGPILSPGRAYDSHSDMQVTDFGPKVTRT